MPVLSVNESQAVDLAGTLTDVFEIIFTVPGRPGSFTVTVPRGGDPVAAAKEAIDALAGEVGEIYSL